MIHLVLLVYKRIDSIAKNGTVLLKDGSVFAIKTSRLLSFTLPNVLCSKSHDRSCCRKNVRRPGCRRVPFAYSACKSEDNSRDWVPETGLCGGRGEASTHGFFHSLPPFSMSSRTRMVISSRCLLMRENLVIVICRLLLVVLILKVYPSSEPW